MKNNPSKFPERYSFILTENEIKYFEDENFDLKKNRGGRRYLPRVFTEQGVAMFATILKLDIAIKVSIAIMDAFVEMRKYIYSDNYDKKICNYFKFI